MTLRHLAKCQLVEYNIIVTSVGWIVRTINWAKLGEEMWSVDFRPRHSTKWSTVCDFHLNSNLKSGLIQCSFILFIHIFIYVHLYQQWLQYCHWEEGQRLKLYLPLHLGFCDNQKNWCLQIKIRHCCFKWNSFLKGLKYFIPFPL